VCCLIFFFQAEDGIRDRNVTGVQTCALPIYFSNCLGKRDGVAVVAHLLPGVDVLAWFAIACPEGAVVEHKYAQAASGEHFREPRSEERRVGKECRGEWSRDE